MDMSITLPRSQWSATLAALDHDWLIDAVAQLTAGWAITPKSLSQSGSALLKLRESALGEDFYLGEIPISRVWLSVQTPQGQAAEGAAHVMSEQLPLCEALAICDAILTNQLSGYEQVVAWLADGDQQRQQTSQQRKAMLKATQVDFSVMDDMVQSDEVRS